MLLFWSFRFVFVLIPQRLCAFHCFPLITWIVLWTLLLVLWIWIGSHNLNHYGKQQKFLLVLYILDFRHYTQPPIFRCAMTVITNLKLIFILIMDVIESFFEYVTDFCFLCFFIFFSANDNIYFFSQLVIFIEWLLSSAQNFFVGSSPLQKSCLFLLL